ncbi:MAG: GDP-L-fucose synthase [Alphaproteobacteria bacterium]|nr:GDP-L-fucose synthase [Alphaproteobacteria bacterium]
MSGKKVWVAGHAGLVGTHVCNRLKSEDCTILTVSRTDLDLRDQAAVRGWVQEHKPDIVIIAAATVGGIGANAARPAEFIYDNLMIEANIIHAAYEAGVEKLLFLGSSCIYPKEALQPVSEGALLSGPLEPTNQPYAIAKIAGIELCRSYRSQYDCDFISAMPCNLYGPYDRFDAENSHVIPALILKAHQAKIRNVSEVMLWGDGRPLREFLYAADMADALVFLLKRYSAELPVNVGSGDEVSIRDLAHKIAAVTGYRGALKFDTSKLNGTVRKVINSSRLHSAGWSPRVSLDEGLRETYEYFKTIYAG